MTGALLKVIACIAMALSHFGYVFHQVLPPVLVDIFYFTGRISFPIFAYLITEGWSYTSNKTKYMGRLFLFAIISQIPYVLALSGTEPANFEWNVMLTLFLGSCSLALEDASLDATGKKKWLLLLAALVPVAIGFFVPMDYGWAGVAAIYLMGLFRDNRYFRLAVLTVAMALVYMLEFSVYYSVAFLFTLPGIFLLYCYNGMRGRVKYKVLFYLFYPLHLMVLYLVEKVIV